jgi:hypothetical protein
MKITKIDMLRDGGTILFTLSGTPKAGKYWLQTPFGGEPRPLFLGGRQLEFSSAAERELIPQLEQWLHQSMTEERQEALRTLDALKTWHHLPNNLLAVVPLYRIRTVLQCLLKRNAQPSA